MRMKARIRDIGREYMGFGRRGRDEVGKGDGDWLKKGEDRWQQE